MDKIIQHVIAEVFIYKLITLLIITKKYTSHFALNIIYYTQILNEKVLVVRLLFILYPIE